MLIEKEVIGPGTYWYIDEKTGVPRKWTVTAAETKRLHDDGNRMLAAGLSVPVPFEHDFQAHPMTPKEKLLNNAGEIKEYRMKGEKLWSVVDVQDEEAKKKVGTSIRWTSPWISSFTDGDGHKWDNVIAHLALTTRPRVTKQEPFKSIAAALSMATDHVATEGFCVSKAGRLVVRKKDKKLRPQYPMAFSMVFAAPIVDDDDMPELTDDGDDAPDVDMDGAPDPLADQTGDVKMEELLCDLLSALGVQMPENVGEAEFKRKLYEATMSKVKELTGKAQSAGSAQSQPNTTSPAGGGNPLIQQEQQPMYMSIEEAQAIQDPVMRKVALSMLEQNTALQAKLEAQAKVTESFRTSRLNEAAAKRASRIQLLSKLSPKIKPELDAMLALPSMALSLGDDGAVIDPMAPTLAMLEKQQVDMPTLLKTDARALAVAAQPSDESILSGEQEDQLVDSFATMMGAAPKK